MTDTNRNRDSAREVYARFEHKMQRGHLDYVRRSRRLNEMYLGAGRQWLEEAKKILDAEGRPCVELNLLLATINAAAGYQINNRVEISYVPRGGRGDAQIAKVLSKLSKSTLDATSYRYHETDAFLDGLIMGRAFFEMRLNFDNSMNGDLDISVLDPRDVLPDPDATDYDPDKWYDCTVSRFYTADEAERILGKDVREALTTHMPFGNGPGWGAFDDGDPDVDRRRFGHSQRFYGRGQSYLYDGDVIRYRLLHRQVNEWSTALVAIWPDTGEIRCIEGLPREMVQRLIEQGVFITRRKQRRVRWYHAAPDFEISNSYSPLPSMSVVPFFPIFRRGETIGLVDNAVSPQELLNKVWSSFQHIMSSTANSGWQGESGVLENMDDDEFTERGSETGLVLLRKPGSAPFEKINPNQIPTGLDRMLQLLPEFVRGVMGINEALLGSSQQDLSGIAMQSLQHAAQQQLALPLDNLGRTRQIIGRSALWVYQNVFSLPRVVRYTEMDVLGRKTENVMIANQPQPDGTFLNDLTIGEYDLAITEVPLQATFENSQFQQGIEMKKAGVNIPDEILIRYSNLLDKEEIIEIMQAAQQDPRMQGEAQKLAAEAKRLEAEAERIQTEQVAKAVEAQFSAIKTAQVIALMPDTSALADQLLRSAGYIDRDAAPIVPQLAAPIASVAALAPPRENSHPLTPENPEAGMTAGLMATPEPV
jgi:hypothetical protein